MSYGILDGNLFKAFVIQKSLTPTSVAANTSEEDAFTVDGLRTTDAVFVNGPFLAGVGVVGARVSANNTLAIAFMNTTAGALTPTAGVYTIMVLRPAGSPPAALPA